jgi:hypothetical protein
MHRLLSTVPVDLLVADRSREKVTPPFCWPVPTEAVKNTHGLSTAALVAEAAHAAAPGRAAVLGCGTCTEIPIRLLNQKFARVDLIDTDARALDIVRSQCRRWADAENSYVFHRADLTGLIAQIRPRAQELIDRASEPARCLRSLGELLESTRPRFWTPSDETRYSLIVCATVLTQLPAGVREMVEALFLDRFPGVSAAFSDADWQTRVWSFARNLEDGFIEHLDSLTAPGGIVFLSDTVHVSWLTAADERTLTSEGNWIATRTSSLADYLRPWHNVLTARQWDWFREEGEGPYWGRLYGVQAVLYRPSGEPPQ